MQDSLWKTNIEWKDIAKESWDVYYKAGQNQGDGSKDQGEQRKSKKTTTACSQRDNSRNDSRDWWPNSRLIEGEEGIWEELELEDTSHWVITATETIGGGEKVIGAEVERKRTEVELNQNQRT